MGGQGWGSVFALFSPPKMHLQNTWRHSRVMSLQRVWWGSSLWGGGPFHPHIPPGCRPRGRGSANHTGNSEFLSCKSRGDIVAHSPSPACRCPADVSGWESPGDLCVLPNQPRVCGFGLFRLGLGSWPVTYLCAMLASCSFLACEV